MLQAIRETTDEGRQIAVFSNTSDQVMYVVPVGRVFEGYACGSGSAGITINGAAIQMMVNSTGANSVPFPLTLLPGTIVRCASSVAVSLWGVEK